MHDSFLSDTRGAAGPGGGAPEPGGTLTDRQRAFVKLGGALVVVCLLALRVGDLWNLAWDADGAGRRLVVQLTASVDIDFAVLVPFGLVTAWMLLFAFDQTKKLQRGFAGVAYLLLIVWLVVVENRWRAEVAWLSFWYAPIGGFLLGIVTGAAPQLLRGEHRWEFPIAALGLFLTASTLCVVAFLDVHLFAINRVPVVGDTLLPSPLSPVGTAIDFLSTLGFVALFGWFLLYSDYRQVAVLSTSKALGLAVMAGLLDFTQNQYDATSGPRGRKLKNAKRPLRENERPDHVVETLDGDGHFEIKYVPPNAPRWSYVSASPIEMGNIGSKTIDRIAEHADRPGLLHRFLLFVADNFLPGGLKRKLFPNTGLLVDMVGNADTLLFVLSIKDFEGYNDNPTLGTLSPPGELDRFTDLCEEVGSSRKHLIVVTDSHEIIDLAGASSIADDGFARFIRGQLLGISDEYTVVPVSWTNDDDDSDTGPLIDGIGTLRRELDR